MKLLLDTHIWIWGVSDPTRLARRIRDLFEKPGTELWLSPISIWELVLLLEKGRLGSTLSVSAWLAMAREQLVWTHAPFTSEVAVEAASFQMPHRDPSGRLLLATARWYGLTLVTADEHLLACSRFARLMPNR